MAAPNSLSGHRRRVEAPLGHPAGDQTLALLARPAQVGRAVGGARSRRPGGDDLQLLVVEVPGDVVDGHRPGVPGEHHHPALSPGQVERQRKGGGRVARVEDHVRPVALGDLRHRRLHVVVLRVEGVRRPQPAGDLQPGGVQVGDDDPPRPGQARPGRQQGAHRPGADDQHVVAQLQARPAHGVQRRPGERLRDGRFRGHGRADGGPGVRRHHLHLTVGGVGRESRARGHPGHVRRHLHHLADHLAGLRQGVAAVERVARPAQPRVAARPQPDVLHHHRAVAHAQLDLPRRQVRLRLVDQAAVPLPEDDDAAHHAPSFRRRQDTRPARGAPLRASGWGAQS